MFVMVCCIVLCCAMPSVSLTFDEAHRLAVNKLLSLECNRYESTEKADLLNEEGNIKVDL